MDRSITKRFRITWHLTACAAAALAAGCQHDKTAATAPPPTTRPVATFIPSSVDEFIEIQTAKGAAGDATLYRGHFDGDRLNSLGREKLALLASRHEAGEHVTVYVDSADNAEVSPARRDAIAAYLAHAGISSADFEIRSGANADNHYAAAEAILGLEKTDSSYQSQQAQQSMSGSSGGYGGSGGSNSGK